jgi:hypothetical protein
MKKIKTIIIAGFALVSLSSCTEEEIANALRQYWGERESPVDACRNDGTGGVLVPTPCWGQPTVDVVCRYRIPHAHQDPDYCLSYDPETAP